MCFFYESHAENLPQPMNTGEILIAYGMRIKPHNHDIQAWSTYNTQFKLVSPGFDLKTLKPDELALVKELQEWWQTRGGAGAAKGDIVRRDNTGAVTNEDGPIRSKKLSTIGGIEVNKFYDIVGEVRFHLEKSWLTCRL
jgi:hypothetical protein